MNDKNTKQIINESTLKCPQCHSQQTMTMPEDYCLWFYDCLACGHQMKPLAGDCCVFCSYGDVPCPPIQNDNACCQ